MTTNKLVLLGALMASALGLLGSTGCGDDGAGGSGGSTSSTSASTGGEGGKGGSGMGGGGGAGGGANAACTAYCTDIMANCKDANAQYADMDGCMGSCAALPPGMAADMKGDTLGCRTYHAGAAKMDPATHCVHAGPGGAGVCGMDCEGFCDIATATCKTEWPDKAACMTACGKFTPGPGYSTATTSGDTLDCRLYHLTVAASSAANATTHCPHTAVMSSVCK
jgi:hypothetical protein